MNNPRRSRFQIEDDAAENNIENQSLSSINGDVSSIKEGLISLKVDQIVLPKTQQRSKENALKVDDLVGSILEEGVLQPILVRKSPAMISKFEVVAGERRYHAAIKAGLKEIPCLFKELGEREKIQAQWSENRKRQNLTVFEEIGGIIEASNLLSLDGSAPSDSEIGDLLKESKAWISIRLSIYKADSAKLMELAKIEKDARKLFEINKILDVDPKLAEKIIEEMLDGGVVSRSKVVEIKRSLESKSASMFQIEPTLDGKPEVADDSLAAAKPGTSVDGKAAATPVVADDGKAAASPEVADDGKEAAKSTSSNKLGRSGAHKIISQKRGKLSFEPLILTGEFQGQPIRIGLPGGLSKDSSDVTVELNGQSKIVPWEDVIIFDGLLANDA